ncbi:hypothetical protein FB45DRAFT_1012449 [Roridomyces roridus]|uniref:Uncharacterized protein n=1 Tax=Roridomyces roridus TaxID=1738132 RepID=A0AAD7AZP7_9AGAR|nr:hypothetical protein FB45DRAFT_1012449 [Roridomyces roridus]
MVIPRQRNILVEPVICGPPICIRHRRSLPLHAFILTMKMLSGDICIRAFSLDSSKMTDPVTLMTSPALARLRKCQRMDCFPKTVNCSTSVWPPLLITLTSILGLSYSSQLSVIRNSLINRASAPDPRSQIRSSGPSLGFCAAMSLPEEVVVIQAAAAFELGTDRSAPWLNSCVSTKMSRAGVERETAEGDSQEAAVQPLRQARVEGQ